MKTKSRGLASSSETFLAQEVFSLGDVAPGLRGQMGLTGGDSHGFNREPAGQPRALNVTVTNGAWRAQAGPARDAAESSPEE